MLKFVEGVYKRMGVSVMTLHMKVFAPFETLCEKAGMKKTEYLCTKYIGE
jgi:hypothetical protein